MSHHCPARHSCPHCNWLFASVPSLSRRTLLAALLSVVHLSVSFPIPDRHSYLLWCQQRLANAYNLDNIFATLLPTDKWAVPSYYADKHSQLLCCQLTNPEKLLTILNVIPDFFAANPLITCKFSLSIQTFLAALLLTFLSLVSYHYPDGNPGLLCSWLTTACQCPITILAVNNCLAEAFLADYFLSPWPTFLT